METEAMKELRAIKDAIANEYKSVRALCEALIAKQGAPSNVSLRKLSVA